MLQANLQTCVKRSLQAFPDLCEELQTSIDTLLPLQSHGRDVHVEAVAAVQEAVQDAMVCRERQQVATARLLSEADQYASSLGTATLDDEELRAIQALPRGSLELLVLRMLDGIKQSHIAGPNSAAATSTRDATVLVAGETAQPEKEGGLVAAPANEAAAEPPSEPVSNANNTASLPTAAAATGNNSHDVYCHAFGAPMGTAFLELVECLRDKKHLLDQNAAVEADQSMPEIAARRGGQTVALHPSQVQKGDVLLLSNGDVVPCDCVAVSVAPTREPFFVDCTDTLGQGKKLLRTYGRYVECPYYGSTTVLPQQTTIVTNDTGKDHKNSGTIGGRSVVIAVAIEDPDASSFTAFLEHNMNLNTLSMPAHLAPVFSLPLFVSSQVAVIQRRRSQLLGMCNANVLLLEREGVLESGHLSVRSAHWWGDEYFANGAEELYHFSDTLAVKRSKSTMSSLAAGNMSIEEASLLDRSATGNVSDSIGGYHLTSFALAEGTSSSRIAPMGPNEQLRRLLVSGMLAVCYPNNEELTGEASINAMLPSHAALKTFLESSQWCQRCMPQYFPLSKTVKIQFSPTKEVYARLFGYSSALDQNLCNRKKDHAVLVIYGVASAVVSVSSHAASPKGIVPITPTSDLPAQVRRKQAVLKANEHCVGVAIADVIVSQIGSKNEADPTDISNLIAKSTEITFQGSFVAQTHLYPGATKAVHSLGYDLRIPVGIFTSSNSLDEVMSFAERVELPSGTVFHRVEDRAPQSLSAELRAKKGTSALPEPEAGRPVVYYNCLDQSSAIARTLSHENQLAVGTVCGTGLGLGALRTSPFGAACIPPEPERTMAHPVKKAMLQIADVIVKDCRLDSFTDALVEARHHMQSHGLVF